MKGFNVYGGRGLGHLIDYARQIEALGSNVIRFQMVPNATPEAAQSLAENRIAYRDFLAQYTDKLVQLARAHKAEGGKLRFIADLHFLTGGIDIVGGKLIHKALYDATQFENWMHDFRYIASQVETESNIIAIEPINEPGTRNWKDWQHIVRATAQQFMANTSKKIIMPCKGIGPNTLAYMPKLNPRRFIATCHFWPPQITLVGVDGMTLKPRWIKAIKEDRFLHAIKDAFEYKERHGVPVLMGEVGCTRDIGDELQNMVIRKVLRHCLKNGIGTCVHVFDQHPQFGYFDSGVLETVKKVYANH